MRDHFFEKKNIVATLQTNTLIFMFCILLFLIFRSFGSGKFNTSKNSEWWFHFRPFTLNLMTAVARGCVTDERELFSTMTLRCTSHDKSIHASGNVVLGEGVLTRRDHASVAPSGAGAGAQVVCPGFR